MGKALRMGPSTFRILSGPFSGSICLVEMASRRSGARAGTRHKGTGSRPSLAGPGDDGGITDGGSAMTSTARSSGRSTYAGPADGQGEQPKRAPVPDGGGTGEAGGGVAKPERTPGPMKELPGTLWGLTKAVNEEEQIVRVMGGLLRSDDEKTRLRIIELLVKTGYSGNSAPEAGVRPSFMEWNIQD